MAIDKKLLEILACPKCKSRESDLVYEENNNRFICNVCYLIYKIEDDIPNMLIDEAERFCPKCNTTLVQKEEDLILICETCKLKYGASEDMVIADAGNSQPL